MLESISMTSKDLAASTSLALNVLKFGDSWSRVNSTEVKMLLGCKNELIGETTEANMVIPAIFNASTCGVVLWF